jgi:hypothetical protein
MRRPVVIFGAGATKACGGPMTDEILPHAFGSFRGKRRPPSYAREGFFDDVEGFLRDQFHLPAAPGRRTRQDYPGLPLLLSLIDTAVDRGQPLGDRSIDDLRRLRGALEYVIFAVLQEHLDSVPEDNPYVAFLTRVTRSANAAPRVITLNYDLIADSVLFKMAMKASPRNERHRLPDYGCEIRTDAYRERRHDYGLLLKLHGSLNWLYCPNCHRLDMGLSKQGPYVKTFKVLDQLYREIDLEREYTCRGSPCRDCKTQVRPVLITPTHRKDYRNPHISRVWYLAERLLREADEAFIVGYSLPADDVEVIYLMKRGLSHLDPDRITVVQHDPGKTMAKSETGLRYRTLFGDRVNWYAGGFEAFLRSWKAG